MEKDFSHLNAIQERLHRETMRFMSTTGKEREFRFSQVKQAEKELAAEYKFLGIEPCTMTDDELLAELLG